MLIVTGEPTGIDWKDTVMDIRIDDNPEPLKELKRLIRIHKAYQHANKGDHYLEVSVYKALAYEKAFHIISRKPRTSLLVSCCPN